MTAPPDDHTQVSREPSDAIALETARKIEAIFAAEHKGGVVQRRARIQCAVIEAMRSAVPQAGCAKEGNGGTQDNDRMAQIDTIIADMQNIRERFGNTCVYIRRFGMSWGAVALNRRDDDKKNGVFDMQAEYEERLIQRAEQVERLVADKSEWMQRACKAEAALASPPLPVAEGTSK